MFLEVQMKNDLRLVPSQPSLRTSTRRIQRPRIIVKPNILTRFQPRMLDTATGIWELVNTLHHATNTKGGGEEVFEDELVRRRAPRYDGRVVHIVRYARHLYTGGLKQRRDSKKDEKTGERKLSLSADTEGSTGAVSAQPQDVRARCTWAGHAQRDLSGKQSSMAFFFALSIRFVEEVDEAVRMAMGRQMEVRDV
jgi:hypothetical protein